jgi:hypothetical protein
VDCSKPFPDIHVAELRKTMKTSVRISDGKTKIGTTYLNASQIWYD